MGSLTAQVSGSLRDGRQVGSGPATVEQNGTLRIAGSTNWSFHKFTAAGGAMPPQGQTLQSADLDLYVTNNYTTAKFNIHCEDNSSPADLDTSDNNNLSNRSITSAFTAVDETVTNNAWRTYNILGPVQELINRLDWSTNSDIAILLDGLAGVDFASKGWVADSTLAAKISLTWVTTVTTANFTGSPLTNQYVGSVSVEFDNTSTTNDPGMFTGGASAWKWEYRNGSGPWVQFSTSFEPTLTGLSAGTYSIRLTATSNDGTSHTFTRNSYFTVSSISTTADFVGTPLTGLYEGQVDSVTFDNRSTTSDPNGFTGGASAWKWEYKIGSGSWVQFSTSFEPTLNGVTEGAYSIRLTATSNNGTSNTFTRSNYFTVGAARTATAAWTPSKTSGTPNTSVDFTDSSTTDDPGGIVAWNWKRKLSTASLYTTFSVAQNPTGIVFATAGTYDIQLTVTTSIMVEDTTTVTGQITITASQISVFRMHGIPGGPISIPAKAPERPLIPVPEAAGVIINALVADITGKVIGEFKPDVETVAWVLNRSVKTQVPIAQSHPKFKEEFFRFGNFIILQFDNGLPIWGGPIDHPKEWDYDKQLVTISSAEEILFRRRTNRTVRFVGVPVGRIFTELIEQARAYYPVGWVVPGEVWGGGSDHSPTYHYQKVGKVIQESLVGNLSAGAYDVIPRIITGKGGTRIEFVANLYGRKGQDKNNVALQEPANVTNWRGQEEGGIVNDWLMVGDNVDGWGDDLITAVKRHEESIAKHGLYQDFERRSGVTIQSTLDETVNTRLNQTAVPYFTPALEWVNRKPGLFSEIFLGDTVPAELLPPFNYFGWKGRLEILGIEFVPSYNVCDLLVRSV